LKRIITYCVFLISLCTGCEEIYTPEIDTVENVLVADARIINGKSDNVILINESLGFDETEIGNPAVTGSEVTLIDSNGSEHSLPEVENGKFLVDFSLDPELDYKLKVEYQGDIFESSFESVPKAPVLDTVYGVPDTKVIEIAGENDVNDFREIEGVRLYADITSEKEMPFYRFTAKWVMQYTYIVMVPVPGELIPETMFAWKTFYPQETFNIASPPEYSNSTDIIRHPLFFLSRKGNVSSEQTFSGWILIMYQHGLQESTHGYYKDLNNQLESEGRLFDPLYVQARSNLRCVNNEEQLILGNFEISNAKEYRYYVRFVSDEEGYYLKSIPYFYDIPAEGEQLYEPPDFWEYPGKKYPDE